MEKDNLLGKHIDAFLQISHEELDGCTTLNENLIPQIDYVMLGAYKVAKFEGLIESLKKTLIPDLVESGVPSLFVIGKIKNQLLDWLNDYVMKYNDALLSEVLDEEEIKVEAMVIQKLTEITLKFDENN